MSRPRAEVLQGRGCKVVRPRSLDLASIHGNDYSSINKGPNVLWNYWERENAVLGPIAGTEANPWFAAYPGIQYVSNYPDSVHMVIAPRRDAFVAPEDLSIEDSTPAVSFLQQFLSARDNRAYAGYNIGPEKDGSQMWWSWHIHLVQFNEKELTDINHRPRIIWEPWPAQIEGLMEDIFINRLLSQKDVPSADTVDLSELDRFGFSSYGSSLLRFERDISSRELAAVMRRADKVYKELHGDLKGMFYEPKGEGGQFIKRDNLEIRDRLREYTELYDLPREVTQNLTIFGMDVLPPVLPSTPTRNSPLTLPNYSAAILRDENGTYFLFQPHIFRKKASALSSLGIFLDYELDTDKQRVSDYEKKKERNVQLVKDINTQIKRM